MSSANLLFLFIIFLGPIISLSAINWILVWVGVELAFLSLIPIFLIGDYFRHAKEAALKYFCIQALGRAFLFVRGVIIFSDYNMLFEIIFILRICLKLGLFPGHFWVLSIVRRLDWFSSFLLLRWQKVAPLALLILYLRVVGARRTKFLLFLGGVRAIVGGLLGNNLKNIRSVVGASSISHIGWILFGRAIGSLWVYFGLYCFVLALTLQGLWNLDYTSSLGLLRLSGLPPFIIFIGKWTVIRRFISSGFSFLFILLPIVGRLLSLIFYLKFFYFFYINKQIKLVNSIKLLSLLSVNMIGVGWIVAF